MYDGPQKYTSSQQKPLAEGGGVLPPLTENRRKFSLKNRSKRAKIGEQKMSSFFAFFDRTWDNFIFSKTGIALFGLVALSGNVAL